MPEHGLLSVRINGVPRRVVPGSTVAAALLAESVPARTSITGEPRAALCGMGVCYECRATVNGVAHQRTCLTPCAEGMEIETR
jgi:predicted molibdopterin-dependent oxidoreductase YjgC